jgi:hypothetical protein
MVRLPTTGRSSSWPGPAGRVKSRAAFPVFPDNAADPAGHSGLSVHFGRTSSAPINNPENNTSALSEMDSNTTRKHA